MTKSEIPDKQLCLLSIIFEVASSRDQLRKTVRLNIFQKQFLNLAEFRDTAPLITHAFKDVPL